MAEPLQARALAPATLSDGALNQVQQLQCGQRVWCGDRRVGHITLLLSAPSGQARSFVLRRGVFRRHDVIVPVAWVALADKRHVRLTVTSGELDSLPEYRDDRSIADAVALALSADARLHALGDDDIGVAVERGMVVLRGHVSGSDAKLRAGRAASAVSGVLGVENRIVEDGALTMAIAQALGTHVVTRAQRIHVHARHGVIYLSSDAASAEVRAVAEACAAAIPEVRGIVNSIQAPGVLLDRDVPRVLQPRIGQQIYAPGLHLGQVERVVINPNHRAVTAIVARGHFPDTTHHDDNVRFELAPLPVRQVIIPIGAVRIITHSTVLLHKSRAEAAQWETLDSAVFVAPVVSWQPPYPYQYPDVLISRAPAQELALPELGA